MLTSYAVVEEPPKEDSEYCKTHMILEDHLRPNCPIEEASVRWVPEPPVVVSAYILAGLQWGTYAYTPSFTSRWPSTLLCAIMWEKLVEAWIIAIDLSA